MTRTHDLPVRARAALILRAVTHHDGSLAKGLADASEHPDGALLQELCYGVCRHFRALGFLLDQLLERPLRNKDADVHALLLIGLYQLRHLRIPPHAAVNETVAAAGALGKSWARSLVNAVLRRSLKSADALDRALAGQPIAIRQSHPDWLVHALQTDWPQDWEAILEANNQRAPMTLRVNPLRSSRDDCLAQLAGAEIAAHRGHWSDAAICLEAPVRSEVLPGYAEGRVSIQDEASQRVAPLLRTGPGQRILDACAAPGGKTAHLLEQQPDLKALVAIDIHPERLQGIHQTLSRLGLDATLICADAAEPAMWWDGKPFDRILLDAPCSATGVIRRHPDIKLLRRAEDFPVLVQRQRALLDALWPLLSPGGLLLYTTCSLLRAENEHVIDGFLGTGTGAKPEAFAAEWGVECRHGRQLLPTPAGPDGFYYCALRKP